MGVLAHGLQRDRLAVVVVSLFVDLGRNPGIVAIAATLAWRFSGFVLSAPLHYLPGALAASAVAFNFFCVDTWLARGYHLFLAVTLNRGDEERGHTISL